MGVGGGGIDTASYIVLVSEEGRETFDFHDSGRTLHGELVSIGNDVSYHRRALGERGDGTS